MMIDNLKESHKLIEELNERLPLRAYATLPLVQAVRQSGAVIPLHAAVTIDSVLYLGDDGGIACSVELPGGETVVVTSITHLRFDADHPLASRIHAYQARRTQRLGRAGRRSAESPASLTATSKRQAVRVDPDQKAKQNDGRQRFQTARSIWRSGEYQQAADIFREVLQLNHDDPHFSRYWLASCLFQLGSSGELDGLLRQHDDNSGIWRFAQALHAFRLQGDSEAARRMLVEADEREPGFEHYLLQDGVVDARRELRFDTGSAERAFGCARLFLPAWRGVPGAVAWARRVLKVPPTAANSDRASRWFPLDELRTLPIRRETWQVGLLPRGDERHGGPAPLWLFGVANVDGRELRAATVIDQPLTETAAWNQLMPSFLRPIDGSPARPAVLVVSRREFCAAWKPLLLQIGIRCKYESHPQLVGGLMAALGETIEQQKLARAEDIDLREIPQSDAVWQTDFIRSPVWVMNEEKGSYRPWSVLVLDKSRSSALTTAHAPGDPTPEMLLEFLVRTMARPGGAAAQRPRWVEVSDSDCYDYLRPRLEAVGVGCRLVDEMSELNELCLGMARRSDGPGKCSLADGRGVTPAQMESFYEAAAYYFREAPWRRVPGEVPIEIRCDDPAVGVRFGIVLGRTGVQLGLCIYDDWEITRAILGGYATADESRALAVCFDEAEIMSAVDLHWIDRLGWPIATPEAWPAVMRLQPRRTPRSPSAEELVFLDACLRAIPDLLKTKATSLTRQVETGTRPVELHLAYPGHSNRRQ
jgi:tetratricopeptide (TPR) repeat protein